MRSNQAVEVVLHTPEKVVDYVTKARIKPKIHEELAKEFKTNSENISGQKIAERVSQYRQVSLAEAYFRIDNSLTLAYTNLDVVFVSTKFKDLRAYNYVKVDEGGIELPGKDGKFVKSKGLLEKYSRRLR